MIGEKKYEKDYNLKELLSPEEEFLEQLMEISTSKRNFSIGILKEMSKTDDCVILSPKDVKKLVELGATVWIESGLCRTNGFSDMDYAEQGAEIVETKPPLILQSNILLKKSAFTPEELSLTKSNQILIAMVDLETLRQEDMLLLERNKITAVGLNLIMDENKKPIINTLLQSKTSETTPPISLGSLVLPLLYALIFSYNIRCAIQTTPTLQQGVYAYQGILCKRIVSEKVMMPWKDLFMLCWDWN